MAQRRFGQGYGCHPRSLLYWSEDPNHSKPPHDRDDDEFWTVATLALSDLSCDDDDDFFGGFDDVVSAASIKTSRIGVVQAPVHLSHPNGMEDPDRCHKTEPPCLKKLIDLPQIKAWLVFYSHFVYNTGNQDILLKLMQWSLCLLGAWTPFLRTRSQVPQLELDWITKLSYDICYARYVTRFLGWPLALEGAWTGSWAARSTTHQAPYDFSYRVMGAILSFSMMAYYPAEQLAFFLWMNPHADTLLNQPADVWFSLSMQCWLVYLLAESLQCLLKYVELSRHKSAILSSKKNDRERSQEPPLKHLPIQNENDA